MNTHPRHYVLLLAALSFFNFTLVESAVGRWSLCYGTPAADVFRAPNGEIPAYTERYDRFGTCPSPTKCYATFSYRGDYRYAGQPGHGVIALLRKYDSSKTGDDYKWVNYGKYLSKLETCKPVYYKNRYDTQVCYLPRVRVKNTQGNWVIRNLLGNCWYTRKAYGTYAGRTYDLSQSWAYKNAQVLCLANTARIDVTLIHVDTITNNNLVTSPDTYIHDSTINKGSTPIRFKFIKKYNKKISSSYSTEHGWKLEVSNTISSGTLTAAVVNFQTTITAGAHGKYITDKRVDTTEEITYEREFEVPPNMEYTISCIIYKQKISVGYRANEKHYDEDGNLLREQVVTGTWTGVTTVQGRTTVTTKRIV